MTIAAELIFVAAGIAAAVATDWVYSRVMQSRTQHKKQIPP
ncbi:MAG: hypothetical protein R3B84_17325 [Zavarzinella sp.]